MSSISCIICLEQMVADSILLHLDCGHVYHSSCLTQWLKTSPTCPDCRKIVANPAWIKRIYLNFTNESDTDYLIQELTQKNSELDFMKINLAKSNDEIENFRQANVKLIQEQLSLNRDKESTKRVLKKLALDLQASRKENDRAIQAIQELIYKENELSKSLDIFKKMHADLTDEKVQLENDKAELTERVDNFRSEYVVVRKQLEAQELENKAMQTRLKIQSELDDQVQKMHQINEDLYRNISFLNEAKSKVESDYKELQMKYDAAAGANQKLKTKISNLQSVLGGAHKKHDSWKNEHRLARLDRTFNSDDPPYGKRWRPLNYNPDNSICTDDGKMMNIKLKLKKIAVNNDWTVIC